jgi:mRNA interferase MazF
VVVVQSDIFNRSRIATVVCIPLTSNVTRADSPGNVLLKASGTGLPKDSIASVPQILSVDRRLLLDRVGQVSHGELGLLLRGIDIVLGR